MSLSADTSDGVTDKKPRAVRRPAPASADTTRRPKGSPVALILFALVGVVVGVGIGVLVMKQRQKAREVVVAVNGTIIDQQSFYRNLENAAGAQVIRNMVGEELEIQFAKKMGVAPTDADVEKKFQEVTSKPGFNKDLLKNKEAMDDLKHTLRFQMSRSNVLTKGAAVTDADVRAYYDANVNHKNPRALFYSPEKVSLAVVVTSKEADIKQADEELLKGQPFADVAKKYSQDNNSKDRGGLLPTLQRSQPGTSKLGPMEDAVFGMKIGAQMGPRQFGKAWWIIRCLDKQPEKTIPFEQVKADCRTGALLTKGLPLNSKKAEEDFKAFQQTSHVQAFWERYTAATNVK